MIVLMGIFFFDFNITMLHDIEKFELKAIVNIFNPGCKAVFSLVIGPIPEKKADYPETS
jgi:hypothetical protein